MYRPNLPDAPTMQTVFMEIEVPNYFPRRDKTLVAIQLSEEAGELVDNNADVHADEKHAQEESGPVVGVQRSGTSSRPKLA